MIILSTDHFVLEYCVSIFAFQLLLKSFIGLSRYDCLHTFRIRELSKLGVAAAEIARRKQSGGTVISAIGTPHIMYAGACGADVPGNPNIAPEPNVGFNDGNISDHPECNGKVLGAGDVLLTANSSSEVAQAYANGCYVVGVGFPMTTNRYSPPNYNDHPEHGEHGFEDMCSIFLYDWAPKEDGVVTPRLRAPHVPSTPMRILPTSPVTVTTYWALMAQVAENLATYPSKDGTEAADLYLRTLMQRLQAWHGSAMSDVAAAGAVMADAVIAGAKLYPWSGRPEFYSEASGTAGGLMGVYSLDPDALASGSQHIGEGDVVIIAWVMADPERESAVAREVKAAGATVIGIFPFTREDENGRAVAEARKLCDFSFDNMSGDVWGVLTVDGYATKIIPTTTIMNNYVFWALVGAYVQALEERGEAPYYWMSLHVPGGQEYDDAVMPFFKARGW